MNRRGSIEQLNLLTTAIQRVSNSAGIWAQTFPCTSHCSMPLTKEQKLGAQTQLSFNFSSPSISKATHEASSINFKVGRHALAKPGTKPHPVALAVLRAVFWGPRVQEYSWEPGWRRHIGCLTNKDHEWAVRSPCHCPTYTRTTIRNQNGLLGFEFFPWFCLPYFMVCSLKESGSGLFFIDPTSSFEPLARSHFRHLSFLQYLRTIYECYTTHYVRAGAKRTHQFSNLY